IARMGDLQPQAALFALQVLVFGTDTQVHPRNVESRHKVAYLGIPK
ncbi:hypothetical protein PsgB076_29415, partial [Pseudomonas savastanoi pv. glycinea str. B076]